MKLFKRKPKSGEVISEADFKDLTIKWDGKNYRHCTFTNCTILISGEQVVSGTCSNFKHCRFEFIGPAANTIDILRKMHGAGFGIVTEEIIDFIRSGSKEN